MAQAQRRSEADDVAELVDELRPLLAELQRLLPEPVTDPTQGSRQHHKASKSQPPWHEEAATALFVAHAGARQLERDLRYHLTGRTGRLRGGSSANTFDALTAITRLVYALPDDVVRDAARTVSGWLTAARRVRDIGLADRWEPLHTPHGQRPPTCPYCNTYSIRVARQSGAVACINPACEDSEGYRPRGRIDKNALTGSAVIAWNDGRTIYYESDAAQAS